MKVQLIFLLHIINKLIVEKIKLDLLLFPVSVVIFKHRKWNKYKYKYKYKYFRFPQAYKHQYL
jgi:hypothetical protein